MSQVEVRTLNQHSRRAAAACIGLLLQSAACGGGNTQPAAPGSQPSAAQSAAPAATAQAQAQAPAHAGTHAGMGASATGTSGSSATPASTAPAPAATSTAGATASGGAGSSGPAAGATAAAAGGNGRATASGSAGMLAADGGAPLPSPGCMGGSLKAGRTMGSIQSSGGDRSFIQYVPQGYDGKTPLPLVVDLHPFSVGASYAESSSGFRQLADTEKYLYLAPQGQGNMWDSVGDMDEKFIRDLVNDVSMKGCVDLRRVYATGCSNGGAFSFLLMCTAEDIFAAVAPMCGTAFFDLQTMCMLDRPVSLMLRIGKQDTLNCWEGEGMTLNAPNVPMGTKVQCAKTVEKVLAEKNHCKGQPKMMAECEYLGDCDEGTEIAICDEDTGHVVYQPNTARDTWAFLKRFYKH